MTSTVHGQSDSLLGTEDSKLLRSIGEMWGRGQRTQGVGGVLSYRGNAGLRFSSALRQPWYGNSYDCPAALIDDDEYMYVLQNRASSGNDKNLIKINTNPTWPEYWDESWHVRVGSTSEEVYLNDMCFADDGNIIVVGYYADPSSGDERFIWKVNSSTGATIWSKSTPQGWCSRVACDSDGNIYIACGWSGWDTGQSAGSLQAYDSDGILQWAKSDYGEVSGLAVAVSPSDEIYFAPGVATDVGGGDYRMIYVYNQSGTYQRGWDTDSPTGVHAFNVPWMKFDDDGYLYLHYGDRTLSFLDFYLRKLNSSFVQQWSNFYETATHMPAGSSIAFTPMGNILLTSEYGGEASDYIAKLLKRANGSELYKGDDFHIILGSWNQYKQTLFEPFFKSSKTKLWANLNLYKNIAKVPIRDSGCFVRPDGDHVWRDDAHCSWKISANDVIYLSLNSSIETAYTGARPHGYHKARESWNPTWPPGLIRHEKDFHSLNDVVSKPFKLHPYVDGDAGTYTWKDDYWCFYVGALVYKGGKYYKCNTYHTYPWNHIPPDDYWDEVTVPSVDWDDFTGFGGKGERDTSDPAGTTPQIYTCAIHGVEDNGGVAHKLNGIYYLNKDLGPDRQSKWRYWKKRPGARSVVLVFVMFGGIENIGNEYTNPESWIKLSFGWSHETPAWSSGTTYAVGESVIHHGTDDIQHCYTCIEEHTNQEPPNATYWEEQEEPWETWSSTYTFAVGDYCLHKGEWYKCATCERLPFNASGYINCVPSDIGKMVYVAGGPGNQGLLVDYDNDLRQWWIASGSELPSGWTYEIKYGTGEGVASAASTTAGGAHTNQEPPNGMYWTHVKKGDDDYPGWKVVYQSDDAEENYGCCYDWKDASNQNLGGMIGQNGTASVYPGIIYQWNPNKSYVTDDIVVWEGRFYQADNNNTDSEPPSGDWTLLGHSQNEY